MLDQPAISAWTPALEQALLAAGFDVEVKPDTQLSNTYYDTVEHHFERGKIGMRVRGCDGTFEQTLKMQKTVRAGMHSRSEYNVPLQDESPNLALFPREAWPEDMVDEITDIELQAQFATDFVRKVVLLTHKDGRCELVFDQGEVSTAKDTLDLNEIEIELLDGDSTLLIDIARCLNTVPLRLSDVSKAAQGYSLLNGTPNKIRPLAPSLHLTDNEPTENVFCLSSETAMAHWQLHEHLFFCNGSAKMLPEIATGIRVLLQSLALFLPVLQCDPMLRLQRDVLNFSEKWLWVDELKSTRFLLSRKGPFFKTLARQTQLISYLQGRQAGLLNAHQPDKLLTSTEATDIKLGVIELLIDKPWHSQASGYELPVIEHARGWLSQGWQTLHQTMQSGRPLSPTNYTAVETLMRQTLFNGFMLSDLFPQSGPVRAPWLDLLVGIDEIRALQLLKQTVKEADLDLEEDLDSWIDEKLLHLLQVMERTRQVAMNKNMYW